MPPKGPIARDDLASTLEDTPALILVLDNDSGRNRNDEILIFSANSVSTLGGVVTVSADLMSLTYDAPDWLSAGQVLDDTFTYTIINAKGMKTDTATVTVTVTGENDQPIANLVVDTTSEDAGIYSLNLLDPSITSDVDQNDVLTISDVSQTDGRDIEFELVNGELRIDTNQFNDLSEGDSEIVTFNYTVDDGQGLPNSTASNVIALEVRGADDDLIYTFIKIADTDDPLFGGGFISGAPSINDAGVLAFNGLSTDRSVQGIYSSDGTSVTTIADSSGIFGVFDIFPTINDSGTVAFHVELDPGLGLDFDEGVYSGSGGAVQKIADSTGESENPPPSGTVYGMQPPSISDSSVVAFVSTVADPLGTNPNSAGIVNRPGFPGGSDL